ncbi:hypothetical protein K501DRAFT_330228 [Backusella circina FSU 941]|nr:hypothetical protein K501DRAFT_330228 [Backusella circina FSU 941]
MKIKSKDIDHLSGCKKLRKKLQKEKKLVKHAKVVEGEALQSKLDFYQTTDMDILKNASADFVNTRQESRSLYYSHSSMKATRKYELQKQRQVDVLCSSERKFVKGKKNPSIMFIGDRGYGVGSPIKGHLKYGGKWKQEKHSKYTPVVITNEFNTSQTCLYCFEKLEHPLRKVQKKDKEEAVRPVNGAFECVNSKCILNMTGRSTIPRDRLSALAIGLSGLTRETGHEPAADGSNTRSKRSTYILIPLYIDIIHFHFLDISTSTLTPSEWFLIGVQELEHVFLDELWMYRSTYAL